MTANTQYDPLELFEGVVRSMLRPRYDAAVERSQTAAGWIPVDVLETDTSYTVLADLPGVAKEDVTVSIAGSQLSLAAERKREKAVDQGQGSESVLLNERPNGTLSRQLQFAADLDDSKAQATFGDGVLRLTLPKKESAQVKRLRIH